MAHELKWREANLKFSVQRTAKEDVRKAFPVETIQLSFYRHLRNEDIHLPGKLWLGFVDGDIPGNWSRNCCQTW